MKLPNWFKILWWVLLLIGLGGCLAMRYSDLISGKPIASQMLVLVVWLALILLPLFQEISPFGLTFKREFEALKTNVREEVATIRSEIRNSVDIRNQFSQSLVFQSPPPDAQLPAIGKKLQAELEGAPLNSETIRATGFSELLGISPDTEILFRARYNVEHELRRLWQKYARDAQDRKFMPTLRIAKALAEWEILAPEVERAVREIWLVASPAIHGEQVTAAKVEFVRTVAPKLVAILRGIS
jgi:hypothetical protein